MMWSALIEENSDLETRGFFLRSRSAVCCDWCGGGVRHFDGLVEYGAGDEREDELVARSLLLVWLENKSEAPLVELFFSIPTLARVVVTRAT
jgi:hypothetical protein